MKDWIDTLVQRNKRYWIGANDINEEGVFEWTDGAEFSFTQWGRGEPSTRSPSSDCATLRNGFWNTRECSERNDFICLLPRYPETSDVSDVSVTEEPESEETPISEPETEASELDESQSEDDGDDRLYEPENLFDLIDMNSNDEITLYEWFTAFS